MNIDLMLQFKNGDDDAFNKIVSEYKKPLFNFIYRFINNFHDSEDILQEVFIRVFKSRFSYKPQQKFDHYLYRIASNLCKDYYKKTKSTVSLDESSLTSTNSTLDDGLEKKETEKIVRNAILSLPYNQRIVLNLVTYEGKTYSEISRITGFSIQSIKSLLFRTRKILKKLLHPQLF